jgi:hypothetical protein
MHYFLNLGKKIENRCRRLPKLHTHFEHISHEILCENPPRFQSDEILHWVAKAKNIPRQARLDDGFGQPSLTLFSNKLFRIDVLFWHTATTAIHQHSFSGAFMVLEGASIQCVYQFDCAKQSGSRFLLGRIRLSDVELLQKGMVRKISGGTSLIHSVFHLASPSVTIVVRTHSRKSFGPEYVYYPPGVALDPAQADELLTKQLQSLELLARLNREADFEKMAENVIANCNIYSAFLVLLKARTQSTGSAIYDRLKAVTNIRFGSDTDLLLAAVAEESRRDAISRNRSDVLDDELRLFLALLINLPNRSTLYSFLQRQYPAIDPSVVLSRWIVKLLPEPLVETPDLLNQIITLCIEGQDAGQIGEVLDLLSVPCSSEVIEAVCQGLHANPLFQPLFRDINDHISAA